MITQPGNRAIAIVVVAAFSLILGTSVKAQQGPAALWVWEAGDVQGQNFIRELNESSPAAGAAVAQNLPTAPEIEYGNGNFYNSANNGTLQVVNASSGLVSESLTLDFGGSFDTVVTAMEFVGGTLYGGATTAGSPFAPSTFTTIDLESGLVTSVGATGIFGPLGGLAYDNGTMYTIEAGGTNPTVLYTVDLDTGAATAIGTTGVQLTGLEFGADGILYGLGRGANQNELFSLDQFTGNATSLGQIGLLSNGGSITSAAAVIPEPSSAMLILAGAALLGFRRKQR